LSLSGRIEDLPLLDIVQIVAFTQRTGYIKVETDAGVGAVVAGTPAPLVGIITPAQHDDVARVLAGLVLSTRGRHRSVPSAGASA